MMDNVILPVVLMLLMVALYYKAKQEINRYK